MRILVINPGSTSTKVSVFEELVEVHKKSIKHDNNTLKTFKYVFDQYDFRLEAIKKALTEFNLQIEDFDCFIGRGGMLRPLESGVYKVNENMINFLEARTNGEHASNLGCVLAYNLAKIKGVPSFIADPVSVDEMEDIAKVTGLKGHKRVSLFHALNQKAIAYEYANDVKKEYKDLNLIIAHLGGGISVAAHKNGRVIDVNNAGLGDGPFTPERTGGMPIYEVIKIASKIKDPQELYKTFMGNGGLVSYLGTNDGYKLSELVEAKDEEAIFYVEAMGYQIAKEIGALSTVLEGNVDQIILTGGLAYFKYLTDYITNKVSFIANVSLYKGEDEMKALASAALKVLHKKETAKEY